MRINGDNQGGTIQSETENETHNGSYSEVTIFENTQIHDGMFIGEFPPNEKNQTKNRHDAQESNQGIIEPIVLLSVFQNKLQRANESGQQGNSPPIDLVRFQFFAIFRTSNERNGQNCGNNSQRNIDVKNVRPRIMIYQIASQWRTQCRSHNYSHSVNSLCHSTFGNGITFGNDGLGSYQ